MNIVTLDFEIHHKGDTDKRIAAATAHLQEHEACIKPLEAELAKPAQVPDKPLYTSTQSRTPMKESDLDNIYVDVLGINALDDTECKIVLKIARLVEKHHGIGE